MTFTLRDGLSFCTIEGRHLFLDLPSDRYFCLSARIEQSFDRLRLGSGLAAAELNELELCGLIKPGAEPGIAPCAAPRTATRSLLQVSGPATSWRHCISAATRLTSSVLELKLMGMASTLQRLATRKLGLTEASADAENEHRIAEVAEAFQVTARHIGIQDQCLPRSIAVAHRLIDCDTNPQLVIGVSLQPFRAHAWVQWRDALVNEQLDMARHFTPILVV